MAHKIYAMDCFILNANEKLTFGLKKFPANNRLSIIIKHLPENFSFMRRMAHY
jgi:hypothetical protein